MVAVMVACVILVCQKNAWNPNNNSLKLLSLSTILYYSYFKILIKIWVSETLPMHYY